MIKRPLLSLILLQFVIGAYSQSDTQISDFEDSVVESYLDHFSTSRERVYTHFNKSSYVPGDAIWFKSYVFNPKNKLPSIVTSNLTVELYNSDGKLVEQKVLFVENGAADNAFFLNSNCPKGKYTFRAYSNWMRNFGDLSDFNSYITVLGKPEVDTLVDNIDYDVQLLPESGIMLEGIASRVAIKAIDPNGNGVKFYGDIVDESGNVVQPFELNDLGMGSVSLSVVPGQKLKCRINLPEGKDAFYSLPDAHQKGVVAQVSQTKNDIIVKVLSNKQTLSSEHQFFMMIHSNGHVQQLTSFTLNPEKTYQLVRFEKSELIAGVNCLTVFNENFKPVAERLFYVQSHDIKGKLGVESYSKGDSVFLSLTALDSYESPLVSNLSVSVLPGGTASNGFTNSLLADVLLGSGLKGTVENPNYYFEGEDSARVKALDDLLLTQGWRKYPWHSILDTVPASLKYRNEKGFTIQGVVGKLKNGKSGKDSHVELVSKGGFSDLVVIDSLGGVSLKNPIDWGSRQAREQYRVTLVSLSGIYYIADVDSLGRFAFTNVLLPEQAKVNLTLINKKGQDFSKKIFCSITPEHRADSVIATIPDFSYLLKRRNEPLSQSLISDNIMIEEVKVVGQRQKKEAFTNSIYVTMDSKNLIIDDMQDNQYKRIEDVLRQKFGVRPWFEYIKEKIWHVDMQRGEISIYLKGDPILIVDGFPVEDLNYLFETMTMSEIESISVNKSGFGLGVRGSYGAIIVNTRTNPLSDSQDRNRPTNTLNLKGYSNPVEYYTPKYKVLPSDSFFTKYAEIYWQPNVITDERGEAKVKFKVPSGLGSIEVRVEGIAKDGQVFLENRKIQISH